MTHHKTIIIVAATLLIAVAFPSCKRHTPTPKPQAYLRIDTPQASYHVCDSAYLPFTFEQNTISAIELKKQTPRDVWVDLKYDTWDGVVFLSYKRMQSEADLRGQTDTSMRLMEAHYQFTNGVEEQHYEDPERKVYGSAYRLRGTRVASTYQFWVTDSSRHFLRGAIYLNQAPNNDSLAPVISYLQADVDHLIETLRWR
ncbi:MAG: hypothetical protein IJ761_02505 [Bacteroidales bacterium]|nr:hypothetical protein [Bacteroidales bacterium]